MKNKILSLNNLLILILIIFCLGIAWLFYHNLTDELPYKYKDISMDSSESIEASSQLEQLKKIGWQEFKKIYVHPECSNNPLLEYAINNLLRADKSRVVSVDAFGKRILRIIIEADYNSEPKYFFFLLSRGKNHLLWETTN